MSDAVRIYLIDTLTLWNLHVETSVPEALDFIASRKARHDAIEGLAELRAVADASAASDAHAKAHENLAQVAVASVLYGLTTTQTYAQALAQHGSIEGHWLYLLYRMHDGNILGRPAFAHSPTRGYLPPPDLKQLLFSALRRDLGPWASHNGAKIGEHGGIKLAPELSKALGLPTG